MDEIFEKNWKKTHEKFEENVEEKRTVKEIWEKFSAKQIKEIEKFVENLRDMSFLKTIQGTMKNVWWKSEEYLRNMSAGQ